MKNLPVKIASVAVIASMALSFAACSKKGGTDSRTESHSGDKIAADSPWFDSKTIDVDVNVDSSRKVDYASTSLVGADEKYLVVMTTGSYTLPDDFDWESMNYNDYMINNLSVIDKASNQTVSTIELAKGLGSDEFIDRAFYRDGRLTVKFGAFDAVTFDPVYTLKEYDPATGNEIGSKETSMVDEGVEKAFYIGDYELDTSYSWDEEHGYYKIFMISPDGNVDSVELKASDDIWDIPVIIPIEDGKVLVPASVSDGTVYYELNYKDASLTELDPKDYEWLDLSGVNSYYCSADSMYLKTAVGVSKVDLKKKSVEEIFNFSWCDINRSTLSFLDVAECSDDSVVLCGSIYKYKAYSNSSETDFAFLEFDRAAKNPHAGKTILELYAAYGQTDEKISEAILNFNSTNSDYFIEVTDRYSSVDTSDYSDVNSDDEVEAVTYKAAAEMSNALAMDILNGEGPDILVNVSSYGQLNSTNYLADLTPYVGDLDPNKYFTNVIDSSKVDGKLFNLPITFGISGIHTDSKYAGASGVGFTPAEYENFLKDTLNGKDVITSGQAMYFAKLFNNMSDKFIANGKADFSCPEFAELADYVKNNVKESSTAWDAEDSDTGFVMGVGASLFKGDYYYDENTEAIFTSLYGIGGYFYEVAQLKGYKAILGIPSSDGRGPTLEPYFSVAVSSQAQNIDACGEFVKSLLAEDIQKQFAEYDSFVISRDAFRYGAGLAVNYYNSDAAGMYDEIDGSARKKITFSDENIKDMENVILSCSQMNSADAAINIILVEEMPAYFSGQKDLASVVAVAQDRVQKVLDERG